MDAFVYINSYIQFFLFLQRNDICTIEMDNSFPLLKISKEKKKWIARSE